MIDRLRNGNFAAAMGCIALLSAAILLPIIVPATGYATQWEVAPVVLYFDQQTKSTSLTVSNHSDAQATFQVTAMRWSQDAAGKDEYAETNDLVFFPKVLIIPAREQKVIRIGIKTPATTREKTYRLFIQEIPSLKKTDQQEGVKVSILVKFGVAIYVKPVKEEIRGEFTGLTLNKGVFTATLKNLGNSHLKIINITTKGNNPKGDETFIKTDSGFNLLSGVARTISISLPNDKCAESTRLEIIATTDQDSKVSGNMDVERPFCLP